MRFTTSMLRIFICLLTLVAASSACAAEHYEAQFVVHAKPESGIFAVEIRLKGAQLPSRVRLAIDPKRHRNFTSDTRLSTSAREIVWQPKGKSARLSYEFVVNHERPSKGFDSYMNADWALFRGDKLVPRARVTAKRGLTSRSSLQFVLPKEWSVVTAYAPSGTQSTPIDDPDRGFDRPQGWMLAGKIGVRAEKIGHVQATIAAPVGESARRQDALSFLNWNLPKLLEVFQDFPPRLLIVSAGDPMWRGGLSGPASLFLHADRPLISENRTSTMLHELVHVATRLRADHESDWIVEGLAEYYSLETLRRSGGISERRYGQAIEEMQRWAKRSSSLFADNSSGATTARAVLALTAVDREIRAQTAGKRSLDDLARLLAKRGGTISLNRLQKAGAQIAGKPLKTLERAHLSKPQPD
jgi:predicted metalloprotease with PDZ domain